MQFTLLAVVLVGTLVDAGQIPPSYQRPGQSGGQRPGQSGGQRPGQSGGQQPFRPNVRPIVGGGNQQDFPAQVSQPQVQQGFPTQVSQPQVQQGFITQVSQPQVQQGYPAQVETTYVTVHTVVNVPTYETVTHEVVVTRTRDVIRTESQNQQQVFTLDVTDRPRIAGRPNVITAVATAHAQSLVLETRRGPAKYSEIVVTVTVTSFRTTTALESSTLRVTHTNNVLEQTVVPVLSVVRVDQVDYRTVTATITHVITSTITHEPVGPSVYY